VEKQITLRTEQADRQFSRTTATYDNSNNNRLTNNIQSITGNIYFI